MSSKSVSEDIKLPKHTMVKWDHEDKDDVALLKWLHKKPKDYIIKEALKLYKKRDEIITDAMLTQAVPQQQTQPTIQQPAPVPNEPYTGDDLEF